MRRGKMPLWLKICWWCFGILAILFFGTWIFIAAYFTPARISEIAGREASKYLNADVRVKVSDYSFFSTYPELYLTIDSLTVVSKSLDHIPQSIKDSLPSQYNLLLKTGRLHAGINISKLLKRDIILSEVEIDKPQANIVIVNDSLNNFNIFPPMPKDLKMPEISFNKINIQGPVDLSFTDLGKQIHLLAEIERLDLKATPDGLYNLDFGIETYGEAPGFSLSTPLKLNLNGDLAFNTATYEAKARNLTIALDGIKINLNFDVVKKPEGFVAEEFNLGMDIPDLIALKKFVPDSLVTLPSFIDEISGNLPLSLQVKTDAPYLIPDSIPSKPSLELLPELTLNLQNHYPANLSYNLSGKEEIKIENLDYSLEIYVDPKNPDNSYLKVPRISMLSEGVNLLLKAEIEEPLSSEPMMEGDLILSTTLPGALSPIFHQQGIDIAGNVAAEARFSFGVKEIGQQALENLQFNATLNSPNLRATANKENLKMTLKNINVGIEATSPLLSKTVTPKVNVDMDLATSSVMVLNNETSLSLSGLKLILDGGNEKLSEGSQAKTNLDLTIEGLDMKSGSTSLSLSDLETTLSGSLLSAPKNFISTFSTAYSNEDEKLIASRISTTPMFLVPNAPASLSALMSMADTDIEMKIGAGDFFTPQYLAKVFFSDLDICTDLNDIEIKGLTASIDDTEMKLTGNVNGLDSFLCSGQASLLKTDLDISFTNVNIDGLAGAYYAAIEKETGKPYNFNLPPQGPYTAADSLCVLIPRNLEGNIRLRSNHAQYMGYRFSPLSTEITIQGGAATLGNLTIGAPYTTVAVDWTYSTASLDDIFMSLKAHVDDFDFTRFFDTFPDLVAKAPEITNLSGKIFADFSGRFNMFPSMFLEAPSMEAKFTLHGDDMLFARSGKIEKITHLMMIKGETPIQIKDMTINGSFHDNLLLLNPFHISFDDYQLGIAGANNLNGEMYYHLALEKSPFHLPFAVNIVGNFRHPEIRFGGTGVHDGRERNISADLQQKVDVNIMTNLHRGWLMFIGEAGKYYLLHNKH